MERLLKLPTSQIHELAKKAGVKNLKAKGRTKEIIIGEIIEANGWGVHTSADELLFLFNGGEITHAKSAPIKKEKINNQSSAGKTKRKGKTEFQKRSEAYVNNLHSYLNKNDSKDIIEHLTELGLWPITDDTKIWGDGGVCDIITRQGIIIKHYETETETSERNTDAPKTKKETKAKTPKKERDPNLITLTKLCVDHGINPKIARRKLRSKKEKPESGWVFTPEEVQEIVMIITK